MERIAHQIKYLSPLRTIYAMGILFSFHGFFILYINSSFLDNFLSEKFVGLLFTVGSALSLVLLLNASFILRLLGTYRTTALLMALEFLSVIGLAFAQTPLSVTLAFLIYLSVYPFIIYTFDILLEASQQTEDTTGGVRGIYLSFQNIALIISPAIAGLILGESNFSNVYIISALFMIPLYIVFRRTFKNNFEEPEHSSIKLLQTLKDIWANRNVRLIVGAQMLLRIFYAWMTIYMPIYLHVHIGFSWPQIGVMFTIMLMPFVLFELPAGRLADKKYGEREILMFGFIILIIATASLSLFTEPVFLLWAAILFLTRTGASLVDIMTETHFFKHVSKHDGHIIGFFRTTQPLSFLIAPLIATSLLIYMDLRFTFIAVAILLCLGLVLGYKIKDTK